MSLDVGVTRRRVRRVPPRGHPPACGSWTCGGWSDAVISAFVRAPERVRAGEDEDGASDAEGVETGDFYALLDNEDAAVVAGL